MKETDIRWKQRFQNFEKAFIRLKEGSDIDLAIMNEGVSDTQLVKMQSDLVDSSLPYQVDLVNYHTLKHPELKSHIDRVGILFYQRQGS